MNTKTKLLLASVSLLTAFAFGRWSAPEYRKTTKDQSETTDSSSHKKTTVIEKEKPDGTKEKKTVVEEDKDRSKSKTDKESEEIRVSSSKTNISVLWGVDPRSPQTPKYGLSVSRPILGPITVGLWALPTDPTVGFSLGLTF